ncbi:MAG: SCO family protein [Verrucomicrobia bacterium]|nr:SCO family protein [Verrucomicrobiota bacterium]
MSQRRSLKTLLIPLPLLVLLAACGGKKETADTDSANTAPALTEGEYWLTGEILSKSEERQTLLVRHDEITGFMPAMTMEFKVSRGDFIIAKPDMTIRAILFKDEEGFRLKNIWPNQKEQSRILQKATRILKKDTEKRGFRVYRDIGEKLPQFALYNQNAELVYPDMFRGKQIVINFIFTRCPDANMCPLSTTKMMQLQAKAAQAGITNLQLISVTLDPEYDTPGVLNEFASIRGIDTSNFSFLTGPESLLKNLFRQLGISLFTEDNLIRHSLNTLLIDESGQIVHIQEGSTWDPDDLFNRLHR